jgi:hypothetical protein
VSRFTHAHGYDAGPTQRPLLVGLLCAAIAEPPTLALLWFADALQPLTRAAGLGLIEGIGLPTTRPAGGCSGLPTAFSAGCSGL